MGRTRSIFFDPRALPSKTPTVDYIAPLTSGDAAGLFSAIINTPAALVVGAAAVVNTTVSIVTGGPEPSATHTPAAASAGGADSGGGLSHEQRTLLAGVAAPKVRGKLPPRKWGKQPSREETHALLAAAAAAAECGESELALRGYLRAFEATRATPLLLSVANMHLRLGELDEAQAFLSALVELEAGLSKEHKAVLARKQNEVTAARRQKAPPAMTKGVSAWQASLDQGEMAKLA